MTWMGGASGFSGALTSAMANEPSRGRMTSVRLSPLARNVYMAALLVVGTITSVVLAVGVTVGRLVSQRLRRRRRR